LKTHIIIQARLGSKRLPEKVLKPIGEYNSLELIYKRVSKCQMVDDIIFAIPKSKENIKLKNFILNKITSKVFLGSEKNVLNRYYLAAKKYKSDIIVRITGDCPLVDSSIIDEFIKILKKNKLDYVYNGSPHTFPDGLDVEVFTFDAIKKANDNAIKLIQKEGVTRYFRDNLKKFKTKHIKCPFKDLSNLRITLDEETDLEVIRSIYEHFNPNINFSWRSIIKLFKKKPQIFKKNSHIKITDGNELDDNQKLWRRANVLIPSGNMLISKNPNLYLPNKWPTYFKKSKKISVWDLKNQKYTDMATMGVGTNILGYANSQIDKSVQNVLKKGTMTTLNCYEEVYLAEKLVAMHPWSEMVKFARTGGEANSISIRIARAASSKDNIAFCGYHGWHDWYLSSNLGNKNNLDEHLISSLNPLGVPNNLKNTAFPFSYGDFKTLEKLIKKRNIGIIKMEVCRSSKPDISFLKKVRNIATKKKIILIFDECTSGFRESFGGLQKKINIKPDILILGKALGNGYPITAVLGKKEIMEYAEKTFISSTFWTDRIGPTAAIKTLEIMEKVKSWEKITKMGNYLNNQWKKIAKENNLNIKIEGLPAISKFTIKSNNFNAYKTFITQEMLKKKFLASNTVYLSIYHDKKIINEYLSILNDLFGVIKKCESGNENIFNKLEGPVAKKPFERLN
jgi:glutamate-1-semialdehyde 2,1-aminomutase